MIQTILLPFSWLYGLGTRLRNEAFDRRWLAASGADVPVISVGNLTAGGTGKTPLVEYLVGLLQREGHVVGVASRGYGRWSRGLRVVSDGKDVLVGVAEGGDEPVQIAKKFLGVRVVVAERRVRAVREAVALGADVVVLDDGFQHRYVARDLDILVADARKDLAREPMLPAGLRREPLNGMRRASLLALSHVDDPAQGAAAAAWFRDWYHGPVLMYRYKPGGLLEFPDGTLCVPADETMAFAFSGIGDHDGFVAGLERAGVNVRGSARFRDHHFYDQLDLRRLRSEAAQIGAAMLVTTEKDAVRLHHVPGAREILRGIPVCYAPVIVEVVAGEPALMELLAAMFHERK